MKIIYKVRADLAYRMPNTGAALGHIVLKREEAEQLLKEHEEATWRNSTPESKTSPSPPG
jgi:hypothetical protein